LAKSDPATAADFRSSLETPRDRFLSELLARALPSALRTAADFLGHFPPPVLMRALAGEVELRADVLQTATSCKRRTALGKSIDSAIDDLETALRVRDTTEEQVLGCLPPDDRVRLLPRPDIWAFVAEPIVADRPDADALVTHLLARALAHELVTPEQVVNAIGLSRLVDALPKAKLSAVVNSVLAAPAKYNSADLLNVLHPGVLVKHLPLRFMWTRVVVPLVAETHGFLGNQAAAPVEESRHAGSGSVAQAGAAPKTTKDQVMEMLREYRLALPSLHPDAGLREIMVLALVELDASRHPGLARELARLTLRDLANLLCQEVERDDSRRAVALRQILSGANGGVRASEPPPPG
jgi:hypothetical protein